LTPMAGFPSTAFVVGATSGIGRALAGRLRASGRTVVIGGRNRDALEELRSDGYPTVEVDVGEPESVRRACEEVIARHPSLGALVTMAGVVIADDVRDEAHISHLRTLFDVNFMGTALLVDALLPHFLSQDSARIVTVGSAGAFVPSPQLPGYAASKAAVHMYTEVLRVQLAGTGVDVTELIPPPVALDEEAAQRNPDAMKLDDFVDQAAEALLRGPVTEEILVGRARQWRNAERDGTYRQLLRERIAQPPRYG